MHCLKQINIVRVARNGLDMPVFNQFYRSGTNCIEETLLEQFCIGFTNKQFEGAASSKFVAMTMSEEVSYKGFFTFLSKRQEQHFCKFKKNVERV